MSRYKLYMEQHVYLFVCLFVVVVVVVLPRGSPLFSFMSMCTNNTLLQPNT